MPIAYKIFDEQNSPELGEMFGDESTKPLFFDQEHCSKMKDHPEYEKLAVNDWDTYRDLDKIFASDFTKDEATDEQIYSYQNTLMIDSDSNKVQFDLANSLIKRPYDWCDVQLSPNPLYNNQVRTADI